MSSELFETLKELLSWASGIALALVAWAWRQNEESHKSLKAESEKAMAAALQARQDAADSHSVLMDRIVTHVDESVQKAITFVKEEDAKIHTYVKEENLKAHEVQETLRGHVTLLFQNAEADRKLISATFASQAQRSEDRHIELLKAIHAQNESFHQALAKKADK